MEATENDSGQINWKLCQLPELAALDISLLCYGYVQNQMTKKGLQQFQEVWVFTTRFLTAYVA